MYRLVCTKCGQEHDATTVQKTSSCCNKPLFAEYQFPDISREELLSWSGDNMWKFRAVMPVADQANIVSLGEGCTPLLKAEQRGPFIDCPNVYIKDEGVNPTGSFKARGISAAISKAKELGIKRVAIPSAGNAAGATAAYAAKAGMECYIFMPEDTPQTIVKECVAYGANVFLVRGLISDCGAIVAQGIEKMGWFPLSTLKEPYRVEGKKTMGYELALDFNFNLPDAIIYPTGGGTGLIGMWKAFAEMEAMGIEFSKKPKMISVQAAGCAPIVRAYEAGRRDAGFWEGASTVASGLRVPGAIGDFLILDAIYQSGGKAVAVSDQELLKAQRELCEYQGVFACPEGGATWAAYKQLRREGFLTDEDKVVLFNTGSGIKYTNVISADCPILDPQDRSVIDKIMKRS